MNMEIAIVKTFCDFGHNVFKKQRFWPFFTRILAISCEKDLATLIHIVDIACNQTYSSYCYPNIINCLCY